MQHTPSVVSDTSTMWVGGLLFHLDLLSDFVTLYTFKMSRKPPDAIYPYGYGKVAKCFGMSLIVLCREI